MKTIKLAWKLFKFMNFTLPMINMVLETVAAKLEAKNNANKTNVNNVNVKEETFY